MSCSPRRVATSPSFAFQQLTYVSDDSQPTNPASACSSSRWMVKVPQMKRTEPVPAPNWSRERLPAATTSGSLQRPKQWLDERITTSPCPCILAPAAWWPLRLLKVDLHPA